MALPIFVVGSSNTDMVVKADHLPAAGETILGGMFLMNPGGKGANQAVAAARLGGNVTFIANLGNDIFGRQALEHLRNEKINTDFVTIDNEYPSGVALINVDRHGENCIVVAPGANYALDIPKVSMALESIKEHGIVLIQQEIPLETVEYVMERVAATGGRVILNPAPANKIKESAFYNLFAITPNETEAELLTGIKVTDAASAAEAASALHKKGVRHVVITLGAKGAFVSSGGHQETIKGPSVTATDTTAAGDCFNGALAVGLSEGQTLRDAVAFACRAASISVTRMGAQASMPARAEVDNIPLYVP
jgi:ribokinase